MRMEITPTAAVRTGSKDILARLMATEDITVIHDNSQETASFDTKDRVLRLPVWKDMTGSIYDMLVGHEVSHALHTPTVEWREFSERVGGNAHFNIATMYLNIVEDARIERMIKDKFPGLRRDFAEAYRQLHARDLFELNKVEDVAALGLIDRINLHYKIGFIEPIPFAAEEQKWLNRIDNAKTFKQVMKIAEDLYNQAKKEKEEQGEQQEGGQPQAGGDSDVQNDNGSGVAPAGELDKQDSDEQGSSGSGKGDSEDGEDSGQSMTDDTDDGESAESTQGQGNEPSSDDAGEGSDETPEGEGDLPETIDGECGPSAPVTYSAEQKALEDMVDANAQGYSYDEIPAVEINNVTVDFKTVLEHWKDIDLATATGEFATFERESRKTVMMMVQQFNMKKAADEDRRTQEASTGVLDTVKMVNYKFSDDIFLRHDVLSDGKNHGLVMLIDWSGSMCDCLTETVNQLMQLVLFCKKVNIPFEVYAFTTNSDVRLPIELRSDHSSPEGRERQRDWFKDHPIWVESDSITNGDDDDDSDNANPRRNMHYHRFALLNLLSSRMNAREYKRGMAIMTQLGARYDGDYYSNYGRRAFAPGYDLGGTPLNEALCAMMDIIPKFQKETGVQIVNLAVLSDGAGSNIHAGGGSYGRNKMFTDPKTRKTYACGRDETDAIISAIKDRTGVKCLGFYLLRKLRDVAYSNYFSDKQRADWHNIEGDFKKDGCVIANATAYNEYYIIKSNQKVANTGIEDLNEDASFTKIKNAFIKSSGNRKSSRIILNRFIDMISV